jgi:hypothetical protein
LLHVLSEGESATGLLAERLLERLTVLDLPACLSQGSNLDFQVTAFNTAAAAHAAGESMAEWFAEGLLERLTAAGAAAGGDADVAQLLASAVLFIVPNMCPDGSVRCVWQTTCSIC